MSPVPQGNPADSAGQPKVCLDAGVSTVVCITNQVRIMHRYTLLAVSILLLAASTATAQWKPAEMGIGVKAGVGVSDVVHSAQATRSKTAYTVGALLNYRQNKWVSFQMELLYAIKGYRRDNVAVDTGGVYVGTSNLELILGYAEIPVLAKFTPPLRGKFRPYLLAGGFMGILVDKKSRLSYEFVAVDFGLDNAEKVDMGAIAGVGIDIKAGDGWVSFETRLDRSLTPAIKDKDQKSQVFSFQFGYWW